VAFMIYISDLESSFFFHSFLLCFIFLFLSEAKNPGDRKELFSRTPVSEIINHE
jgi:hypothetical protein